MYFSYVKKKLLSAVWNRGIKDKFVHTFDTSSLWVKMISLKKPYDSLYLRLGFIYVPCDKVIVKVKQADANLIK